MAKALAAGAIGVLGVAVTCAAAGIIVGVVTLTGLGLKFSTIVIQLAHGNLLLTAMLTSLVVWIVGLAVPVTASYIICAVIAAPALTKLGVPAYAAHMFVFYYAVLSEVSPPVALSPFAAAAITGGNPYRTMMLTWKYALPCFLVPFMFTQPDGLAILWRDTTVLDAVVASVSAAAGIVALVAGVGGFLLRPTRLVERALLVAAGLLLLAPGAAQDIAGLALFSVVVGSQLVARRAIAHA